ncbi:MAG: hypothetical protein ACK5UP_04405 [Bacteroidota bacterium]|jgi:hypothetical protein
MQTTKATFEILISDDKKVAPEHLFAQLDKFISRTTGSSCDNGATMEYWRRGDNCEIFAFTKDGAITKIGFRFDHSDIDHKFKVDIIDFAIKNGFKFLIRQELIFSPNQLTTELINENSERQKVLDDPLTFLRKQK